jgi:Carboxypeptidase regulatory-like domain
MQWRRELLAAFGTASALAVAATLCLLPTAANAQGTSTANIVGVVRDVSGAVVPGVTVEATSPALIGGARTAVTDERGEYRLSELPPGTYVVTFTASGFATVKREGLELSTNFTAQVDVQLTLSQQQQTVTVESSAALVDTQSVTQQQTIERSLLDSVPTAKSALGIAALIPAVVEPPNAQDVGGSKGERSVRITVHGGHTVDARLLQDGMRYNALTPGLPQITNSTIAGVGLEGTGRGYYIDPLAIQEVLIDTGTMGSALYEYGGATSNAIPKDGGNELRGSIFAGGTDSLLQSNNLDQHLINQGLSSVNTIRYIYDYDGGLGGPIIKNKLWFFVSARRWGTKTQVGNLYADSFSTPFLYTPNYSKPIQPDEADRGFGGRLTYQATAKDKLTFSYNRQHNFQDQLTGLLETGTIKNEANAGYCQQSQLIQATWTHVQSPNLLFDVGLTNSHFEYGGFGKSLYLSDYNGCGGAIVNNVSITDVVLGYTYNGSGNETMTLTDQDNGRFNATINKGPHNIQTGLFMMIGTGGGQATYTARSPSEVGGLPVAYTFANGVPTSLTEFTSPNLTRDQLNHDLGIYVQDQWRVIHNLTVTAGLRLDLLVESVNAVSVPAGLIIPARSYPAIPNVPNWKDLDPRLGVTWDPFGKGKTAIKYGINRYVTSNTTGIANLFDQAAGAVTSTTRSWHDTNGNFIPDCNLALPQANGECGPMANANFGTYVPVNTPDPHYINGWFKRPYNWQTSAGIQQQVLPNLIVNAGYFRTWYGNFMASDNIDVTPADYSPYCVPVPVDPRLPDSGKQLCGLYDINPAYFGMVSNVITNSSKFGHQTEIYNGVDVNFQLRWRKLTLGGGWNIGNGAQLGTTAGGNAQASTNDCFVISNPQQLFECKVTVPYQSRFKFNGTYNFSHGILFAAVVQSNPGATYNATNTFTLAQIEPSLGRPISGGVTTETFNLMPPYTFFGPRINQMDVRVTKVLRIGERRRVQLNADVYNVFNSNTPVTLFGTYGPHWGQPTQVLDGRLAKFSTQFDF